MLQAADAAEVVGELGVACSECSGSPVTIRSTSAQMTGAATIASVNRTRWGERPTQ